MVYKPPPEVYECLKQARAGDDNAARALLRLYRLNKIGREIKPGKPWSNRVKKCVDFLTAGVGCEGWEYPDKDGKPVCLLLHRPPLPHEVARYKTYDDD